MIRITDPTQCCGCSACSAACPHGAISMVADGMGFRYPVIDPQRCTDCGACEKVCSFHPADVPPAAQAEAIRFPELLDQSQSGGLAYALMRKATQKGYTVYGAALDKDFVVRHRRVTDEPGLEPLRLSKYVQSDLDGIPQQVRDDLQAGRQVFFTGTPCQCAGVASLAGGRRNQLLLADIICHGVPSPAVWSAFLKDKEKRHGRKLTGALFRDKALGWHDHRETLLFGDEKVVSNEYTFLFYRHLMLRPACTLCPFASLRRPSDLTMADCWGVEQALPGFADDNRGCSLLMVHTEAGKAFSEEFPDVCVRTAIPVPTEKQPNLYTPSLPHKKADVFRRVFLHRGYAAAWKRFSPESRGYRLEKFIEKVKRHL